MNGKNANNKVHRWGCELATYNITFEQISGAKNKAADCLSHLGELPPTTSALINMLSVSNTDGPAVNTRSHTQQCLAPDISTVQPSVTPDVTSPVDPTPKSLMADRLEAFLQMQKTDPFCKQISKCLSNGKAPKHEMDLFTHVRGLLCKHIMDSGQKFLALVIPKSWKYTVLVEAHDKNKDIRKYIDLVTECETSTSGNQLILTIIDHFTGWPEAFPIPDRSADTIVSNFNNKYLPVHMCPRYILSDNGTEFKNNLMDQVLKQLGNERIF